MPSYYLLTQQNPKILKGEVLGWKTLILHLLPWTYSGHQVCPAANGCQRDCLAWSGRGPMINTVQARMRRTKLFFDDRQQFMQKLVADIMVAQIEANVEGMRLAIRLNGTSDLPWEKIRTATHRNVMEQFPNITFYDYTKVRGRKNLPANYRLTFSDVGDALPLLQAGHNVSVIFDNGLPETYLGFPVINGDEHDLRFLDPSPCIVGLERKTTRLPAALAEPLLEAA